MRFISQLTSTAVQILKGLATGKHRPIADMWCVNKTHGGSIIYLDTSLFEASSLEGSRLL